MEESKITEEEFNNEYRYLISAGKETTGSLAFHLPAQRRLQLEKLRPDFGFESSPGNGSDDIISYRLPTMLLSLVQKYVESNVYPKPNKLDEREEPDKGR